MKKRRRLQPEIGRARARLRTAGLRPTKQRLLLADLLFRHGNRHVTAEMLHHEAQAFGSSVSLATVYNTLHQFTAANLLQQVVVEASRSYFDTNTGPHQHFFDEHGGELIDIPGDSITVSGLPAPPRGTSVSRVDVVVRLRRA